MDLALLYLHCGISFKVMVYHCYIMKLYLCFEQESVITDYATEEIDGIMNLTI